MRRTAWAVVAIMLSLALFASTDALARGGDGGKGSMDKGMMAEKMKGHHGMTTEMMDMLKETMAIVRDMNHTPTAAQKERLSTMINRMDELMKDHDKRMKNACEWKEKKSGKKMKNPCGSDDKDEKDEKDAK